jgi:hypothetical protein
MSRMSTEHQELLAAYFAWERASDACFRKLAHRCEGAPVDRADELDMCHLQCLYSAWLAKLEPLKSTTVRGTEPTRPHAATGSLF